MFGAQTQSAGFGSGTGQQSGLFGQGQNQAGAGSGMFGSSNTQKATPSSLFAQSSQQSQTQPSLLGSGQASQPAQLGQSTQPSLFGKPPSTSSPSLFNTPSGQPSLFNGTASTNSNVNMNSSLMSSQGPATTAPPGTPGLLGSSLNSQPGGSFNTSTTTTGAGSLSHSQSLMDLSRRRYEPETPQWGRTERRYVPSHMDALRTKSSFSTPDRGSSSSLRASVVDRQAKAAGSASGGGSRGGPGGPGGSRAGGGSVSGAGGASSPPQSFGPSFGTPKPLRKKASIIDEEDAPPTQSIYDTDLSERNRYRNFGGAGAHGPTTYDKAGNAVARGGTKDVSKAGNAVIVFGYPPSMLEAVIAHFSRFGTILESLEGQDAEALPESKRTWSGRNWVQITYKDGMAAGRALAENGTVFGGGMFVIGCVLATDANTAQLHSAGERSMIESGGAETGSVFPSALASGHGSPDAMEEDGIGALEPPGTFSQHPVRGVSRTTSMPTLVPSSSSSSTTPRKRIQVHKGNSIYSLNASASKQGAGSTAQQNGARRTMRFSPSLANIRTQADSSTAASDRPARSQGGFLSFAAKRARELVFGWDDL